MSCKVWIAKRAHSFSIIEMKIIKNDEQMPKRFILILSDVKVFALHKKIVHTFSYQLQSMQYAMI